MTENREMHRLFALIQPTQASLRAGTVFLYENVQVQELGRPYAFDNVVVLTVMSV